MEKLTDRDKWLHFAVCAAAAIVSPMLAIGLAIGKEYGDKNATGNHWCWLDLLADGLGVLAGGAAHVGIIMVVWWWQ